jgi:hypothetical protein
VITSRNGREVYCQLRPGVFDVMADRERVLLGMPQPAPAPADAPAATAEVH